MYVYMYYTLSPLVEPLGVAQTQGTEVFKKKSRARGKRKSSSNAGNNVNLAETDEMAVNSEKQPDATNNDA
jgi:hypothetical protein